MQAQHEQPFPSLKFFAVRAILQDKATKTAALANANTAYISIINKNEAWLPIYETMRLIQAGLKMLESSALEEIKSPEIEYDKLIKRVKFVMFFMMVLGGINHFFKDHEYYWPVARASLLLIVLTTLLAPKISFLRVPFMPQYQDVPEFLSMIKAIEANLNRYAQDANLAAQIPRIRQHLSSFRNSWFKSSAVTALNNLRDCYTNILATSEYFCRPIN